VKEQSEQEEDEQSDVVGGKRVRSLRHLYRESAETKHKRQKNLLSFFLETVQEISQQVSKYQEVVVPLQN
jgi:hypothetical protein